MSSIKVAKSYNYMIIKGRLGITFWKNMDFPEYQA